MGHRKLRSVIAMRGFVLAIIGLAVASFPQVPTAPTDQISQKQVAPGAVSGRVLTAADGAAIKSARVALVEENASSHPRVFAATTDNDGRFEIKKVSPGRYHCFAAHTGYISQQYQAKGTRDGALLTLAPGQRVDDALFRLVRAAVVSGRVVDEDGEPMAKVLVTALRKPSAEEKEDWGPRARKEQLVASSAAVTDDHGEYRIFGLKPGEYYVKTAESEIPGLPGTINEEDDMDWTVRSDLGRQYAPVFYPGVLQLDQAQPVTVAAGEEVQAEFALRHVKTVEIQGHVIAADGRPATHAYVLLSVPEVGDDWGEELSAGSDAKGEFTIKGVPPGSYILSGQQHDGDKHYMARQKVEVGNDNIASIVIAFGKGRTINGRVVTASPGASALDRIHIQLEPTGESDTESFGWAQVKQRGSFEINDVLDGSYALQVYGMEQGWYVTSARLGAEDVLQKGLQMERGTSTATLEIVLSSASAQLEGAVSDHDKPAVGAQVRVKPDPETTYNRQRSNNTSTDQNGHFIFHALPPGKYRVTARLRSASSEAPVTTSDAKIVTLGERDHQAVQLTLATAQTE
jgi:protocatechuate 3,4-dioxygenase beta subunit